MEAIPIVSGTIILGAPLLSNAGLVNFAVVENPWVRLIIVVIVLAAVRTNALNACLAILAAVTLFSERNHEILTGLSSLAGSIGAPASAGGVPVKALPLTPEHETHAYEPAQAEHPSEKDELYEDSTDLGDSNPRLKEAPDSENAPGFFEQRGLA